MNFKILLKPRSLIFILSNNYYKTRQLIPFHLEPGIYPYPKRQIPSDGLKSLDQRLKEIENSKNDIKSEPVNIGYKLQKTPAIDRTEKNINLERLARKRELFIDLKELDNKTINSNIYVMNKFKIANFYNIYNDMFHCPHYFYSIKNIEIEYNYENDEVMPIYAGNLISPQYTSQEPNINFHAEENCLYTLIMSSPDEHLEHNDKEYVHWIISNMVMKDGVLTSKDVVVPYLQPIPYLGTGFHRYVFVLYKQDSGPVDLSSHYLPDHCHLEERTFSSYEFLKTNQANLTPIGLSFFQAAWDPSVRECFREKLNCLEPIFEFQQAKVKLKPMEEFPENKVMHSYFDQYRDVKDIREEVLKERLKTVDPFKVTKQLEFPLGFPIDENEIGFVNQKFKDKQLRIGQWREMDVHDDEI